MARISLKTTVFLICNTVYYLLLTNNISSVRGEAAGKELGQACELKDLRKTPGVCSSLQNCGYALSNYRAGIQPSLCLAVRNRVAVACCPTDDRISYSKCQEYKERIVDNQIRIRPLIALRRTKKRSTDDLGRKLGRNKCEVAPSAFIVGGKDARAGEFPYMVGLGYGEISEKRWLCGGTLISDEFVLTAAHCIDTHVGKPRRALLGNIYLEDPGNYSSRKTIMTIQETFIHPEYRKPLKYNDIALIKLKGKVRLTRNIVPACLPQPQLRLENLKEGRVTGWGKTDAAGYQSNLLQTAMVERLSQQTCNDIFSKKSGKEFFYPQGILRSQFCAGDKVRDTCGGDSGGPLTVRLENNCFDFVTGITSFGSFLCGYGEPGVYTNVQSYLDWIENIVWPNE